MERKEYNGWTNYETWVVNLWLTNYAGTYDAMLEMVRDNGTNHEAAEAIRNFVEEYNPFNNAEPSLFTDLMNAALSEVNWFEIARSFREVVNYEARHEGGG